jgi:hypothetical protein
VRLESVLAICRRSLLLRRGRAEGPRQSPEPYQERFLERHSGSFEMKVDTGRYLHTSLHTSEAPNQAAAACRINL